MVHELNFVLIVTVVKVCECYRDVVGIKSEGDKVILQLKKIIMGRDFDFTSIYSLSYILFSKRNRHKNTHFPSCEWLEDVLILSWPFYSSCSAGDHITMPVSKL